ncbi:MAG: ABC transporter permease [Mycoplasma sp.]
MSKKTEKMNWFKEFCRFHFDTKLKRIGFVILLIVPMLYSFLYLYAFWNPLEKIGNGNYYIVNQDTNPTTGTNLEKVLQDAENEKIIQHENDGSYLMNVDTGLQKLSLHFHAINDPNHQWNSEKTDGSLVIPPNFNEDIVNVYNGTSSTIPQLQFECSLKNNFILSQLLYTVVTGFNNFAAIIVVNDALDYISKNFGTDINKIKADFQNFFEHIFGPSYATEIKAILDAAFGTKTINEIQDIINSLRALMTQFAKDKMTDEGLTFINFDITGKQYFGVTGIGLAPFFIALGIWMACAFQHDRYEFVNKRRANLKEKLRNYFKNYSFFIAILTLQILVLWLCLTALGVRFGFGETIILLLTEIVAGIAFSAIVYAMAYFIRNSKITQTLIIVTLILQYLASDGTYPVFTEPLLFRGLSYVTPWTYFVRAYRELISNFDWTSWGENVGIMLLIAIIFIIIAVISLVVGDKWLRARVTKNPKLLQEKTKEAN